MTAAMVSAKEIRWTLAPVPALDVRTMTDEELFVTTLTEADAYRNLSQQGIHAIHDLLREHHRLRCSHARLIADYRNLRATITEAA